MRADLKAQILHEWETHPLMELQDGIKFLFQATMGCEHMLADEAAVLQRINEELKTVSSEAKEPTVLGESFARLPLSATAGRLKPKTVAKLFLLSGRNSHGDREKLREALGLLYVLPFSEAETEKAISDYTKAGMPAVSHSRIYRDAYQPHYRVVRKEYVWLLPLLTAMDRLEEGLVAIDGPCGSGKTTAGQLLAELYGGSLFHMDDFFLPPERKTPERLAEIGGNVDYERFRGKILNSLLKKETVHFTPYCCSKGGLGEEQTVPYRKLNIIEGSYSLHPTLRDDYDLKAFLQVSPEAQMVRIEKRNGSQAAERFRSVWIPLENIYFEGCHVKAACDVTVPELP